MKHRTFVHLLLANAILVAACSPPAGTDAGDTVAMDASDIVAPDTSTPRCITAANEVDCMAACANLRTLCAARCNIPGDPCPTVSMCAEGCQQARGVSQAAAGYGCLQQLTVCSEVLACASRCGALPDVDPGDASDDSPPDSPVADMPVSDAPPACRFDQMFDVSFIPSGSSMCRFPVLRGSLAGMRSGAAYEISGNLSEADAGTAAVTCTVTVTSGCSASISCALREMGTMIGTASGNLTADSGGFTVSAANFSASDGDGGACMETGMMFFVARGDGRDM